MQSVAPDIHGIAVLLLIVAALTLFSRDRIPIETSSLFILIALVVLFEVFPYERAASPLGVRTFVSGFGNQALIAICSLIIVGKGLEVTGALQPVAAQLARRWSSRPLLAPLLMLLAVACMSGFVNDTPIVVLMIPILSGLAMQTGEPVSKIMLPMGLATIIGGMSTAIGTSTNLLVIGFAESQGVPRIGMFDFSLPVLIVGGAGMLYVWLVVPRLLPDRKLPTGAGSERRYAARLTLLPGGYADGRSLSECLARTDGRMRVDRIQRSESVSLTRLPNVQLRAGDQLFVTDTAKNIKDYEYLLGAGLPVLLQASNDLQPELLKQTDGLRLAEVVVTRGSPLHQRRIEDAVLDARGGATPIGVHRSVRTPSIRSFDLYASRLDIGDVVLVQGTEATLSKLKDRPDLLVLDGGIGLPSRHRSKRALAVLIFVVAAAATGLLPIAVSAMIGVGLMLAMRCLTWREAALSLPIPVIMIIVTSLALGKALVGTGMAEFLAGGFVSLAAGLSPPFILSAFLLIVSVLTNIVSNNAAAVIATPIAIATAEQLGVDPMAFVLAVLFGANMSFATPFGYQTNLLIMSAAGYRFADFLRAGVPLIVLMWLGFSLVLPRFYDLH